MELQTFIFIGRSGCGKGTQVALLQEYIKKQDQKRYIFYIETGERFRQFIKEHSLSSRLAAEIYKTGSPTTRKGLKEANHVEPKYLDSATKLPLLFSQIRPAHFFKIGQTIQPCEHSPIIMTTAMC